MACYYSCAAAVLALAGPRLFVLLFARPFVADVGFASVVNWGWHIFADPAEPAKYAASTITVMDWAGDVFNEGLHLTHHLRPAAHFSEVRQLYSAQRDFYIANSSLLLSHSDPLEIWAMAMLHRWGYFAERLVDYSGQMTPQQKRAFVRYRTRPIGSKPASQLEAAAVAAAAGAAAKAAARLHLAKAAGQHALRPRAAGRVSVTAAE
ncbi:hypothetical protein OEZ86_000188 [Tetradesmus obliquus]|nr:hypothetical protein OEZ86_000188 [Tetradesmus obliquus]